MAIKQIKQFTNEEERKNTILSPKLDIVFQNLFGEVGSEEITKDLLSTILDEQINEIDLNQNIVLRRRTLEDKMGVVDVLAKINNNEYCNIEMQIVDHKNSKKRTLYYWAKKYTQGIQKGNDYKDLKRTICVLIADFEVEDLEELGFHSKWKIIDENERKKVLTDDFEIHIIELPKIRERKANGKDKKLLEWLSFLENPESKEVTGYMEKNKNMKQAKEKLNTLSADEEMRILAELREKAILDERSLKNGSYDEGHEKGLKEGRAEGRAEGLAEGLIQKNRENAKKMKERGYKIEEIMEITNLTRQEIEQI